ncbi:MAG: hypothetical protein ACKO7W_10645, partial [Elainella sp.]
MMPENQSASPILALALKAMMAGRLQKALNSQEFSLFLPILPSKFDKITGYLSQIRESIAAKADFSAQIQLKRIQS